MNLVLYNFNDKRKYNIYIYIFSYTGLLLQVATMIVSPPSTQELISTFKSPRLIYGRVPPKSTSEPGGMTPVSAPK